MDYIAYSRSETPRYKNRYVHFKLMGRLERNGNLIPLIPVWFGICKSSLTSPFFARYATFQGYCRELKKRKKHKTFIIKPANGAMGNG